MARKRAYRSGSVYRRGTRSSWRIRWWDQGQRRYMGGFRDRATADMALAKILQDIQLGHVGIKPQHGAVPTLDDLARNWIERREKTHRSAREDRHRWNKHLGPRFGRRFPDQVNVADMGELIRAKLAEGLSPSTVRLLVAQVGSLYTDLVERELAKQNPVRLLTKATRRLIRPTQDPRKTPFVKRAQDIGHIFKALQEPVNVAYALGALAGLRSGEIPALEWSDVDLPGRRMHIARSITGKTKDGEVRTVPIVDALNKVLVAHRVRTDGRGKVVPPMRSDGEFFDDHTMRRHLRRAFAALRLPRITWYQATRHTFASQWVMAGGGIERLRDILGHSTVQMTERYAHLVPDVFSARELSLIAVDVGAADVVSASVAQPDGSQKIGCGSGASMKTDGERGTLSP